MNGTQLDPMAISGAWTFTPRQFGDDRGAFLVWFHQELLEAELGYPIDVRQANCAVSAAGVIRGIHLASVPPGQAKYVICPAGAVLDVVVDLRRGSPTFGKWDSVRLDDVQRRAVYVGEGLGHAVMSLEDGSVITYLCSTGYAPEREFSIHPLDLTLAINWPSVGRHGHPLSIQLSPRDAAAPTLHEAEGLGLLPEYETVRAFDDERRTGIMRLAGDR